MWMEQLNEKAKDNGLQQRLEKNIMKRAEPVPGGGARQSTELLCNFDEDLLALFSEVSFWEKFHGEFSIPYVAHDICNKRETLRVMRETTLLVIRAYNAIINDVSVGVDFGKFVESVVPTIRPIMISNRCPPTIKKVKFFNLTASPVKYRIRFKSVESVKLFSCHREML